MKQVFFSILMFLLVGISAKSQNIVNYESLVGKWKVSEFQLLSTGLSKEEISKAETLKNSFLKAHFEFKADQHFSFDFDAADMKIQNAHWKYNSTTNSIVVQEWKDRNSTKSILMEIYIKQENDKLIFLPSETPFALHVEKEN